MARYIDLNNSKVIYMGRDKFGNGIYSIPPDLPTIEVVPLEDYQSMERTVHKLALALAEAQQVRRGRWKSLGMGDYMCSLCGNVVSGNRRPFCPECKAKMRGWTAKQNENKNETLYTGKF